MSTTSISVVLATYNGANYLLAQLDSLLKQTLLPDEIIFSDDCSTDATELIISEFIKLNKGKIDFKYYVNNGLSGVYYNFENALIHVSGDIIFLCDQDDIWFEKKLEFHKKKYEELNCISVISDALFVDESLKRAATENIYDIYLLTYIDTPWEEDDLRDRPGLRLEMFNAFEQCLIDNNRPYILLKGDKETRLKNAVKAIDQIISSKENLYSYSESLLDLDNSCNY